MSIFRTSSVVSAGRVAEVLNKDIQVQHGKLNLLTSVSRPWDEKWIFPRARILRDWNASSGSCKLIASFSKGDRVLVLTWSDSPRALLQIFVLTFSKMFFCFSLIPLLLSKMHKRPSAFVRFPRVLLLIQFCQHQVGLKRRRIRWRYSRDL
jgi:hypothetical protein